MLEFVFVCADVNQNIETPKKKFLSYDINNFEEKSTKADWKILKSPETKIQTRETQIHTGEDIYK